MSRRSRRVRSSRGFTLVEAMVSIVILVIVMVTTLTLLYGMQAFGQRQQAYTFPRQSARSAINYIGYHVEGAGDLNIQTAPGDLTNPNALLMYYDAGGKGGGTLQASYNNIDPNNAAQRDLADPGTDIITLAIPDKPMLAEITLWPSNWNAAANMYVNFRAGCDGSANQNQNNMWLFQQATSATPLPPYPNTDNQSVSGLLTVVNEDGRWVYFIITGYQKSDCSAISDPIHITANPGGSGFVNPPGGRPELGPTPGTRKWIVGGVVYRSFRVKNHELQQKNGIFDPTVDGTAASTFFPIAESIEDLQVAYLYGQGPQAGTIWNTGHLDDAYVAPPPPGAQDRYLFTRLSDQNVPNGIPSQSSPDTPPNQWDVRNVIGVRVSLTGRSLPLGLPALKLTQLRSSGMNPTASRHYRPPSEDHDEDRDPNGNPLQDADALSGKGPVYDHVRLTTTLMLRNRALGN